MQEHPFSFDIDADRHGVVKLEVERQKAKNEVAELRTQFASFWLNLIVAISLFSFAFSSSRLDHLWRFIPFGAFVVLTLFSQWRNFRQVRQRLESWNAVAQDYKQITK